MVRLGISIQLKTKLKFNKYNPNMSGRTNAWDLVVAGFRSRTSALN